MAGMNPQFKKYLDEMARQRKKHPNATQEQLRAYTKRALKG